MKPIVHSNQAFMKTLLSYFTILFVTASFLFGSLSGCDSRQDNVDLQRQEVLYLILTRPKKGDLLQICVDNQEKAFACADEAGEFSYVDSTTSTTIDTSVRELMIYTLDAAYELDINDYIDDGDSAETEINSTVLCGALLDSENFPIPGYDNTKVTSGGKTCILNCTGEYWERVKDEDQCTLTEFGLTGDSDPDHNLIVDLTEDEDYNGCLELCYTRGTVFPGINLSPVLPPGD